MRKITFYQLCEEAEAQPLPVTALMERVAEATGVTIQTVYNWRSGRQVPGTAAIKLMAMELDLDFDTLYQGFEAAKQNRK